MNQAAVQWVKKLCAHAQRTPEEMMELHLSGKSRLLSHHAEALAWLLQEQHRNQQKPPKKRRSSRNER